MPVQLIYIFSQIHNCNCKVNLLSTRVQHLTLRPFCSSVVHWQSVKVNCQTNFSVIILCEHVIKLLNSWTLTTNQRKRTKLHQTVIDLTVASRFINLCQSIDKFLRDILVIIPLLNRFNKTLDQHLVFCLNHISKTIVGSVYLAIAKSLFHQRLIPVVHSSFELIKSTNRVAKRS